MITLVITTGSYRMSMPAPIEALTDPEVLKAATLRAKIEFINAVLSDARVEMVNHDEWMDVPMDRVDRDVPGDRDTGTAEQETRRHP